MTKRRIKVPLLPRARDTSCPYVEVAVWGPAGNPVRAVALVDTGASGITISARLAERCKAAILPGKATTINFIHRSLSSRVAGVWLAVGRADVVDAVGVAVLRQWDGSRRLFGRRHDVIIGARWLCGHGAVIDMGRRTMTLARASVRPPRRKKAS